MKSLRQRVVAAGDFASASLGRRLALNLFAYSLIGLAAILFLLGTVIDQRFSRLEAQEIAGHVERSRAMLDRFERTALSRALDWAVWDDSFDYLAAPNKAYETDNLNLSSMRNIDISGMSIVRFDGSFCNTIFFDLASGNPANDAAIAFQRQVTAPAFAQSMRRTKTKTGFVRIGDRILVIAAAQVFRSDESGTPLGYLVMGKELKGTDVGQALQLPAMIVPAASQQAPQVTRTDARATIVEPIAGVAGASVAALRFSVPRRLHEEGSALLWITLGGVALLLTIMIFLLNWRLRAVLVRPVKSFQAHVSEISSSGELAHFDDNRGDELGELYREFNRMTDELETLRSKVEAQSFAIGRSDIATDIMHNVRNAISPVRAILGKLDQRLHFPAESNVKRALQELEEDGAPPDRRARLLAFVSAAIDKLRAELGQHRNDVREALRGVSHVDETISTADSFGRSAQQAGDCDLSAVVGASLAIARHSSAADVKAEFHSEERFRVALPRVLLAQILDNILTNAIEAIDAGGRGHGEIGIRAARGEGEGGKFVHVVVTDNGDGLDPARAATLFERGSSGRRKEHGGIGLHWCANTLNACGGSIALRSDGIGHGSTVEITLPLFDVADATSDAPSVADAA